MPTQIRLRPHQPALKMLNPHRPLRPIQPIRPIRMESILVLQIGRGDHNRRIRFRLEPQFPIPRHVLNGQESAIGDDDEI